MLYDRHTVFPLEQTTVLKSEVNFKIVPGYNSEDGSNFDYFR